MKLQFIRVLLLVALTSLTFSIPINTETVKDVENIDNHVKRYDANTYIHSIGHFFTSKDVKRNVFYNGLKNLDVYYSKKDKNGKNPVLIYIFGGSWYLGEKSLYSKLGEALRDRGIITVIPNYIQFPFGDIDEMTHDISESIKWVYKNIHNYGGDKDNIVVLGHSSGAHLLALTLLKNSLGLEANSSDKFIYDLPMLKRVVLLNGPYDFDLLSDRLKKTGNKPENSGTEAFLKAALNSNDACPIDVLKKYQDKSIKSLGAELIVLMHAEEDATVPVLSSYELLEQIERTTNNPATLYLTHGYYHCGITEGVMNGDEEAKRLLIDAALSEDLLTRNKSDSSKITDDNKTKEKFIKEDTEDEIANNEDEDEARKEAEENAKKEAEEKAIKEAEEKAKKEAEEKAKKETEEKAKKEAEEKAKKEAEEKAKKEAEEKAKKEAEEKAKKEAEEKAKKEAEEKAKKEAEEKAKKEAEEKAKKEAEEKARKEAEQRNNYNDYWFEQGDYWFDNLEKNAKKGKSSNSNFWFK